MRRIGSFLVGVTLLFSLEAAARDSRRELTVNLKFIPQEGVKSILPDLPRAMLDRAVELRVEDGRDTETPLTIGQGTNDDDKLSPIVAGSDVAGYIGFALKRLSTDWGLKVEGERDPRLTVRVTRFMIDESNKALGSMYKAEVTLGYVLAGADGRPLAEGAGSGKAHRYGRSRSVDNCNEVLSDALKEAFADALSTPLLQAAWASGTATPASGGPASGKETVDERLRKLDDLLKKGLITKDEHSKKRAEILKDI